MKEIALTQGQVAVVCDCHAHLVAGKKWCAQWHHNTQSYYAVRSASLGERVAGAPPTILMHAVINGTPKGLYTDHENRNTLDNQCSNLRTASSAQNCRNQKKPINNTSGFIGVTWDKRRRKWRSQIMCNGKNKYAGDFDNPEDAARAHDRVAIEFHGEFATLNFKRENYIQ